MLNESTANASAIPVGGSIDCSAFRHSIIKLALFFFGTIGNVITLLVLRRQTVHARSYALTLTVLTVLNSLTLFSLGLDAFDQILSNYGFTFEVYIGDWGCKVYRLLPNVFQLASHWVVVLITVERFCAVCFPLSLGRMFSLRGTRIGLTVLLVVVVFSQVWRIPFDHQQKKPLVAGTLENGTTVTAMVPVGCFARNAQLYFIIDSFVNQLFLVFLLPALFIICLNAATALHILKASRDMRRMSRVDSGDIERMRKAAEKQQEQVDKDSLLSFKEADKKYTRNSKATSFQPKAVRFTSASDSPDPAKKQQTLKPRNQQALLSPHSSNASSLARPSATAAMSNVAKGRTRKSVVLLMTLTGCFLLCMLPQLCLLLYLRVYHMLYGREASFFAFLELCQFLNATSVLTTMNYADNFIIFFTAGRGFRGKLGEMFGVPQKQMTPVSTPMTSQTNNTLLTTINKSKSAATARRSSVAVVCRQPSKKIGKSGTNPKLTTSFKDDADEAKLRQRSTSVMALMPDSRSDD